jgi:hypothetical protein
MNIRLQTASRAKHRRRRAAYSLDDEWLEDAPAACSASSMNSFTLLPTNIHVSLRLQHKHSH